MRYKIGEFSKLAKVTVKTLRYYDDEGILKPESTDRWNGYRYYSEKQLEDICRIREFRNAGLSIEEVREICRGKDPLKILGSKRSELENRIRCIDSLMEAAKMKYTVKTKELPGCITAFRHGRIDTYADTNSFVFGFA